MGAPGSSVPPQRGNLEGREVIVGEDVQNKNAGTARLNIDLGAAEIFRTQRVSPFVDDEGTDEPIDIPWVVEFRLDGADTLHERITETMTIGRGSGAGAPDIDLTPYFASENGVSRRHAIVLARRRFLTIRDLNSTNGTFINGLRLMPQQDVPLEHGDRLRFGKLRATVMFALVPPNRLANADHSPSKRRNPQIKGEGRRVVVHEQGKTTAEAYHMILNGMGYRVQTSRDVTETAALVAEAPPAAVVIDMTTGHSETEAFDLVRLLKNRAPEMSVLLVVPANAPQTLQRARAAAPTLVVSKPLHAEELVSAVGYAIKGGNGRRVRV
jgi:pSer/pThr/pTyr-binding forkhead associated (FHA) protein